ncbi:MAG: nuclear transport factor 2 family protein [Gammaproteobacteria bacterium]|nr:nuclear transport factor 2 family protein [Gammaproteobacteria bacterium]MCP5200387.1 nuclear transport factor 2 family protein [Gammaproteobacteria bacterium]
MPTLSEIVQRGWDAVAAGDMDTLVADYTEDMIFVMPGQTDVIEGVPDFRAAVENLGAAVPTGFEIVGLRHIEGNGEVVTICSWKSEKVESSQVAVLFRFRGDKIFEERWFVDTEQWKAAF